ncbi:MAG: hypothetical protein EXX96DRAFT_540737 [Benjaminiella poitrasii]|nr:MAG: hypothetical protein EXX96DRAFT_540737 [Benjaminiella poitrasii]
MGETDRNRHSKKRALMFADFYDVVPVALIDEDGNEVDIILSPSHIDQLQTMLEKPKQLTLRRPAQDVPPENMFPTNDTVHSIGEFVAISQYLLKRHYIVLNKDMTATLNQDWKIKPSQRFMVTRALIGSVIIDTENHHGLLVLSLEVSIGFTHQSTSVSSSGNNDFWIGTLHQPEGTNTFMKLILGAHPFNALVTSSVRIDNLVDQPECRPNTVNFVVPPQSNSKYKIYLDSQSWSDSLMFDNNTNLNSIYTHSRLMQLRQIFTIPWLFTIAYDCIHLRKKYHIDQFWSLGFKVIGYLGYLSHEGR